MRLALLIKDTEYRNAMAEHISESGGDVLLDIISKGESIESDALILTDAKPADIDTEILDKLIPRTVFLSNNENSNDKGSNLNKLFKYANVSSLLADISDVYCKWKGLRSHNVPTSRIISCCTDSDAFSHIRCNRLASQIIYRQGGSVLILPLGYISEQNKDCSRDINHFARMMYRIRKGRAFDPASVSYTDSYGISRLMLPPGRNPIAYLDEEDLNGMITALSVVFENVVLDIGSCYRAENLTAIRNSNSVLCFQSGRKRINFNELLKAEEKEKLRIIRCDERDEGFELDEYIREIYGIRDES